MRRAIALAMILLMTTIVPVAASESSQDAYAEWAEKEYCEYFEATGKYVCFGFKSYWHDFGGLEIFGYPITNEIHEDGRTVQYFQRARFEWHPGVWPARHDVLQGRLGSEVARGIADQSPFAPVDSAKDGCEFFAATGHNVCGNFLKRWEMSGGLPVFGYPISEAFVQDGMTVQYFERQRMEHQPGVWPERHDVLLGLLGVEVWDPTDEPDPTPQITVVASDLVQPRGLLATDHGLYVSEAGSGGDGPCVTLGSGAEGCLGTTGALTLVDAQGQRRIADGISSLVEDTGEGVGLHDIALDGDGNVYVVVGLGGHPDLVWDLGEDAEDLAAILKIHPDGGVEFIADIAEHEASENPDGTDLDTNPYGMAWDSANGLLLVADAGGNSLLAIDPATGDVETVAVFEPRMTPAPPFIPADEIPMESVPTNVAVGPDGNYYVSELTGFPFTPGAARIYKVTPYGEVSVHADGFTNLGDVTFDAHGNLYALEIVAGGLLGVDPDDPTTLASRIIKITPDGSQTEYMFPGMLLATGISVGADGAIYVANLAVTPDAHVLRIVLP